MQPSLKKRERERRAFLTVTRIFIKARRVAFSFMSLKLNRSDFPKIVCPLQIIYKLLAIFKKPEYSRTFGRLLKYSFDYQYLQNLAKNVLSLIEDFWEKYFCTQSFLVVASNS